MRCGLTVISLLLWIALSAAEKVVVGYFPNWLYANYPVERIPFDKYTHINYAFAILNTPDNLPSFTDDWAVESSLPKLVELSHRAGTKVLLAIGGWTGSKRFSPMVASPESRKRFIDWNLEFIDKYNIDGIDLDWEHPGRQAAGCNEYNDKDADNLLLLLQELRQALDERYTEHKEISMAVHVAPFTANGKLMSNVSAFVPYFDHIHLMTYDINGAWASETGPNAPFQYAKGKGAPYSFVDSIDSWIKAGVPANKITAGLAFYGRSMQTVGEASDNASLYQPAKVGAPKGDADDAYWADPYCAKDPDGLSGVWKWTNLRSEGILLDDLVTAGHGWQRHWDDVTKTPWLYNPQSKILISYDDPQSLQIKVDHALCMDLAGVMVWDIHQDNNELLTVVSKIRGERPATCPLDAPKPSLASAVVPSSVVASVSMDNMASAAVSAAVPQVSASSPVAVASSQAAPPVQTASVPAVVASSQVAMPVVDAVSSPIAMVSSQVAMSVEAVSSPLAMASSQVVASVEKVSSLEFTTTSRLVIPTNVIASVSTGPIALQANGECPVVGQQSCAQSGLSPDFLTCNFGRWTLQSCATGTVCYDDAGALYCDYPKSGGQDDADLADSKASVHLAVEHGQAQ